jgi:hypothetical protein
LAVFPLARAYGISLSEFWRLKAENLLFKLSPISGKNGVAKLQVANSHLELKKLRVTETSEPIPKARR